MCYNGLCITRVQLFKETGTSEAHLQPLFQYDHQPLGRRRRQPGLVPGARHERHQPLHPELPRRYGRRMVSGKTSPTATKVAARHDVFRLSECPASQAPRATGRRARCAAATPIGPSARSPLGTPADARASHQRKKGGEQRRIPSSLYEGEGLVKQWHSHADNALSSPGSSQDHES